MSHLQDSPKHSAASLPSQLADNRLLDVFQMAELTSYSVAHIRRMYRTGKFPKPLNLGGRKALWPVSVARKLTEAA